MSARSVPVQSLPIHLRDSAKGDQVAVALDEAAKRILDDLGVNGASPMIEAAIRAQADVYTKAAVDIRRFIGRNEACRDGGE